VTGGGRGLGRAARLASVVAGGLQPHDPTPWFDRSAPKARPSRSSPRGDRTPSIRSPGGRGPGGRHPVKTRAPQLTPLPLLDTE
jgi:hypothetical protein